MKKEKKESEKNLSAKFVHTVKELKQQNKSAIGRPFFLLFHVSLPNMTREKSEITRYISHPLEKLVLFFLFSYSSFFFFPTSSSIFHSLLFVPFYLYKERLTHFTCFVYFVSFFISFFFFSLTWIFCVSFTLTFSLPIKRKVNIDFAISLTSRFC